MDNKGIALAKKEYMVYKAIYNNFKSILGEDISNRVDRISIYEGTGEDSRNCFGASISVWHKDNWGVGRDYTDNIWAEVNKSTLKTVRGEFGIIDRQSLNRAIEYFIDAISTLPYSITSIEFNDSMGRSYKEKKDKDYKVYLYMYPKEALEEAFKKEFSYENYCLLLGSIDRRDENEAFGAGERCPINRVLQEAKNRCKELISIKDAKVGDNLVLVYGNGVGFSKSGDISEYYKGLKTIVTVGNLVDIETMSDGIKEYYKNPCYSITVTGSTFYGVSGGAYNSPGRCYHGNSKGKEYYVADKKNEVGYLSCKRYIRFEDFYKILKEAIFSLKDDFGLFI